MISPSNYKSLINNNTAIQFVSDDCNAGYVLKRLSNYPKQIILGHLNIISIRKDFDLTKLILKQDIDIFSDYRNKVRRLVYSFTI